MSIHDHCVCSCIPLDPCLFLEDSFLDVGDFSKIVASWAVWAVRIVVSFGGLTAGGFRLFHILETGEDGWGIGLIPGVGFAVAFVGPMKMLIFRLLLVVLGTEEGMFVSSDGVGVFLRVVSDPC